MRTAVRTVALLIWAAAASCAPAMRLQSQSGTVSGTVVDAGGAPVVGARVGIPSLDLFTVTSATGRFSLSNVPFGEHTIVVTALGYGAISRTVLVAPGQASTITVVVPTVDNPVVTVNVVHGVGARVYIDDQYRGPPGGFVVSPGSRRFRVVASAPSSPCSWTVNLLANESRSFTCDLRNGTVSPPS